MQKEILTKENIKKDLKKYYFRKITEFFLSILLIPAGYIIVLNLILLFNNPTNLFKITFSIIFWLVCFLLYFYELVIIIVGLAIIKKGDFQIISDWIVNKKTKQYNTRLSNSKPYRLIFAKSGVYNIPYGKNYFWSDLFSSNDKNIFEYTYVNDEFYIINIGRQKNIIAYNKKHFEFKE